MNPSNPSYAATIEVTAGPDVCFEAITKQMHLWWTETTEGEINEVGDRVKAIFPPGFGFWEFEATALEAAERIELTCIDAEHRVAGQPSEIDKEWLGTRIVWTFENGNGKSRVTLTHHGLTPELNCWDICQDGWDFFFTESLKNFLNGEPASPHTAA